MTTKYSYEKALTNYYRELVSIPPKEECYHNPDEIFYLLPARDHLFTCDPIDKIDARQELRTGFYNRSFILWWNREQRKWFVVDEAFLG